MDVTRPVRPCTPPAPYVGGKRNLAKRLIARIEAVPHDCYAEAFVGMGGVFLRRSRAPKSEVINDYNSDVANLFRILQRHYVAFLDMLRFQLTTRSEFKRLVATDPATLTDLERAARFLYVQNTSYGGRVAGPTFGVAPDRPARFDVTRLGPILEHLHERLSGVTVECLPYHEFIPRYDRPYALFYLDPPYWGTEEVYGKGLFERADFERLADVLRALKGHFILSLNDIPELRDLFSWARLEEVQTTYHVQGQGRTKRAQELIITND